MSPPSKPKAHEQTLPQALPSATLFALLSYLHPLGLNEALRWNIIQSFVLDAEFPAHRPEVLAVTRKAQVERIRGLRRTREAVGSLAFREPVETEQVHDHAATASAHTVLVMMMVCGAASCFVRASVLVGT